MKPPRFGIQVDWTYIAVVWFQTDKHVMRYHAFGVQWWPCLRLVRVP